METGDTEVGRGRRQTPEISKVTTLGQDSREVEANGTPRGKERSREEGALQVEPWRREAGKGPGQDGKGHFQGCALRRGSSGQDLVSRNVLGNRATELRHLPWAEGLPRTGGGGGFQR